MSNCFICPVCGFVDRASPPYGGPFGPWSQEFCPSCGTQFDYDDCGRTHSELREAWVAHGAKWWSSRPQPEHFNGIEQLRAAGFFPEPDDGDDP